MVDIVQVPSGMSLSDQIKFAERVANDRQTAAASADHDRTKLHECVSIDKQLDALIAQDAKGDYVPIEQVNANQKSYRALTQRRNALGCYR